LLSTVAAIASAVTAAYLQDRFRIVSWSDSRGRVLTSAAAGLVIFAIYFVIHVVRAPWKLATRSVEDLGLQICAKESKIEELQSTLEAPHLLAEIHDYIGHAFLVTNEKVNHWETAFTASLTIRNFGRAPSTADCSLLVIDAKGSDVESLPTAINDKAELGSHRVVLAHHLRDSTIRMSALHSRETSPIPSLMTTLSLAPL